MANLLSFDLNLLRVLDALLQENSTVKAAKRLNLTQPAVSAALARLRAALGDELFFRRGQGLERTAYAASLEAELREVMDRIGRLIQPPGAFDPAVAQNRFRISGSDFFAEMLMPRLAERLQAIAPLIRVHLVDLVPDNYVGMLEDYEVDLALIPKTALPDWTDSQPVFRSSFSVVVRAGHPALVKAGLSTGDEMPLDLFCELGHVLFSPEGKGEAMGDKALAKIGRTRHVVMTMPVFSGVYRAVAGSDLIALLPTALAHQVAASAKLDVLRPPMPIARAQLMQVWHRRFTSSPAHIWLRTQIADVLKPLESAAE